MAVVAGSLLTSISAECTMPLAAVAEVEWIRLVVRLLVSTLDLTPDRPAPSKRPRGGEQQGFPFHCPHNFPITVDPQ